VHAHRCIKTLLWQSRVDYRKVSNFREGLIFVIFASQEPFTKIKTAKISQSTCEVNKPRLNLRPIHTFIQAPTEVCQWVCLWWLSRSYPENRNASYIRKHRRTNKTAEAIVTTNALGTRLHFSPYWNKGLKLPSLFVNDSRHLLSF